MRRWAWLLVLAVTLAVWAPTLTYQWVETWDDAVFILGNPHVTTWSWTWMATTQWYGHWMPLTWLSFVSNYALFGFYPMSWHAVNVGLHAISAVLVFAIARRLVGSVGGAVFAALLFAVHPLRMESVAWISERKDVVVGVFFLGAVLLWMQGRRWWSFAAFIAACASKSPAVMLPVVLLALEWYRVGTQTGDAGAVTPASDTGAQGDDLRSRALSLWPFFSVSAVVSVMAFWSLHTILVSIPWSVVGLGPRLLHVAYSLVFYAMQTAWPAQLSGLIEYTWVPSWNQPQYPISVAVVLLAAVLLWRARHRYPALLAAAVAYAVAVLPQSGIFQNGPQLVGNRYSYLACLPLALLAGGALTMASRRWRTCSYLAGATAIAGLVAVTSLNLPMWKNGDAMWWYAAKHEPTCTQCQDMAAAASLRHGNFAQALQYQRQAVTVSDTTMHPRWERHWNLAAILLLAGRNAEAALEMRTYLDLVPAAQRETEPHRDHMQRARTTLATLDAETRFGRP